MPAAPGAIPRKMLPPPITTPSSTPRRETCAISLTIASMVWRLMPKAASPIRASPDSLRRILLYLGVKSVHRLRLVDALAHHEERVGVHLCLLRAEHLLNRLLVVLDERLAEQRPLVQELVERALAHLGRDLGRL